MEKRRIAVKGGFMPNHITNLISFGDQPEQVAAFHQMLRDLRQKDGVGRIQFQKDIYIPKLSLGLLYGIVDIRQRLFQPAGIAADLYRNALDPACHASPPPENGHRKSPDFSELFTKDSSQLCKY